MSSISGETEYGGVGGEALPPSACHLLPATEPGAIYSNVFLVTEGISSWSGTPHSSGIPLYSFYFRIAPLDHSVLLLLRMLWLFMKKSETVCNFTKKVLSYTGYFSKNPSLPLPNPAISRVLED